MSNVGRVSGWSTLGLRPGGFLYLGFEFMRNNLPRSEITKVLLDRWFLWGGVVVEPLVEPLSITMSDCGQRGNIVLRWRSQEAKEIH